MLNPRKSEYESTRQNGSERFGIGMELKENLRARKNLRMRSWRQLGDRSWWLSSTSPSTSPCTSFPPPRPGAATVFLTMMRLYSCFARVYARLRRFAYGASPTALAEFRASQRLYQVRIITGGKQVTGAICMPRPYASSQSIITTSIKSSPMDRPIRSPIHVDRPMKISHVSVTCLPHVISWRHKQLHGPISAWHVLWRAVENRSRRMHGVAEVITIWI